MAKNYYLILGVSSNATADDIKTAFRRRALELHPDRSGLESGPFQDLQEAYGVLADPERRRHYDDRTSGITTRHRPWGPAPGTRMSRPKAEPMRDPALSFSDVSLADSFEALAPSLDELFERLWSNFESVSRPKSEHLENLTVEVVLSPEEALQGGHVRVWIPARATCPVCGGHGALGPYECWQCEGHGAQITEYPVEIDHPPGARDGDAARISLARFGIENLFLTVLFRVSWQR